MAITYDPKAAAAARAGGIAPPRPDYFVLALLIASNTASIVWAVREQWPLIVLLVPYWLQSVVIGWYYRRRILALTRFSTAGFEINGEPVAETPETKRSTANFLAMHYGFFHFVYAIFLGAFAATGVLGPVSGPGRNDLPGLLALCAMFVLTQRGEYQRNVAVDRGLRPNIGAMMFLPYLRIVPMHLMIILGAVLGNGAGALVLFGALKTAADLGMQVYGQRLVARSSA